MSPIELDMELARRMGEGMRLEGGIELPFLAPVLWVINGDARMSKGGAQFYGGWASKAEDVDDIAQQMGLEVPSEFTPEEIIPSDNKAFSAYTARSIIAAPIGLRQAWVSDGVRHSEFVNGARRHVQALVYMAVKGGKNGESRYEPWGPVVLSAKGYQAGNLINSFSAWDRHTASIRRKVAAGVPAWCFYLAVGTFGKERSTKMVGKGSQSPITPIGPYLPENIDEALLERLFVGEDTAAVMVDLLDQAGEWLNAWKADVGVDHLSAERKAESGPDNFLAPGEFPDNDGIPF